MKEDAMFVPLIFAKKLRLPSFRAGEKQSLHMAVAFARAGAKVAFFPGVPNETDAAGEVHRALEALGYADAISTWTPLPAAGKLGYGLRFRAAVFRAMWRTPDAAVYTRDLGEASLVSHLALLCRRPLFFEAHEVLHLMHKAAGKDCWPRTRARESAALRAARGVVATSRAVAEQIQLLCRPGVPVLVSPNGYNQDIFYPLPLFTPENPWPGPTDPVEAVYVGGLMQGKGVNTLLAALHLLPERFRLRIAGGGTPQRVAALRRAADKFPDGRVRFFGELPQRELREACRGAHMFVIPQQSEFFFSPLKLLEALALGLPTLVTPLALFESYAQPGTTHILPGKDAAGIACGMAALAENPVLAAELRRNGLAWSAEHTWTTRAKKILDFMAHSL